MRAHRRSDLARIYQKVHVLQYQNRVEFIPVHPKRKMRGFLKGIDTTVARDTDRV